MLPWAVMVLVAVTIASILRLAGSARAVAGVLQVLSWVGLFAVMIALYIADRARARALHH